MVEYHAYASIPAENCGQARCGSFLHGYGPKEHIWEISVSLLLSSLTSILFSPFFLVLLWINNKRNEWTIRAMRTENHITLSEILFDTSPATFRRLKTTHLQLYWSLDFQRLDTLLLFQLANPPHRNLFDTAPPPPSWVCPIPSRHMLLSPAVLFKAQILLHVKITENLYEHQHGTLCINNKRYVLHYMYYSISALRMDLPLHNNFHIVLWGPYLSLHWWSSSKVPRGVF